MNRDSWHRRLTSYVYRNDDPPQLCDYFWSIWLAVIAIIPVAIFRAMSENAKQILGVGAIFTAIGFYTYWLFTIHWIIGIAFTAIVGFALFNLFNSSFSDWWNRNHPPKPHKEEPPKEDKPSMTLEFLKAKKNKYCPRLEWHD